GKGLIFLLHGKPGLGKTFTAEAVAEETHRPLYYVTTGELGTSVPEMESQLQTVFKLGWRWGAVVLLDEADVIMAKRSINDLSRSAIVAVFLRLIEYYRGLLFLTTNRVDDFDPAFYNRIHAMIEYPQLSQDARTRIWKSLLVEKKKNVVHLDISWKEDESRIYKILGELETNGRDIRNLIRTAYGIARSHETDLGVRHIVSVMK
ncbi:P-loop containing nucleoside triphosphate hydrolase protein, partial [Trematosphaeria pertusa]